MSDDSDEDDASEGNGALPPLVIDADGLNVLAKIDDWPSLLPSNTIITPHPREFARLAGIEDTAEVQANRLQLAQQKAKEWGVIVVLKGAFTVVAAPDGESASVSPFASAKLATAGTGDVLAGAITGLLAQGMQPYAAAVAGVWLHGWAGTFGTINRGALASDVMFALGEALEATSVLPPVNR
jgi:NAD(P)H-hydrate epimerase